MKVVLNRCYGGFSVNKDFAKANNLDEYLFGNESLRYNKTLINAIENGDDVNGDFADLKVLEIPDNATDYTITESDGFETLIYVTDGLINLK